MYLVETETVNIESRIRIWDWCDCMKTTISCDDCSWLADLVFCLVGYAAIENRKHTTDSLLLIVWRCYGSLMQCSNDWRGPRVAWNKAEANAKQTPSSEQLPSDHMLSLYVVSIVTSWAGLYSWRILLSLLLLRFRLAVANRRCNEKILDSSHFCWPPSLISQ